MLSQVKPDSDLELNGPASSDRRTRTGAGEADAPKARKASRITGNGSCRHIAKQRNRAWSETYISEFWGNGKQRLSNQK
jgi:hypothetical protein